MCKLLEPTTLQQSLNIIILNDQHPKGKIFFEPNWMMKVDLPAKVGPCILMRGGLNGTWLMIYGTKWCWILSNSKCPEVLNLWNMAWQTKDQAENQKGKMTQSLMLMLAMDLKRLSRGGMWWRRVWRKVSVPNAVINTFKSKAEGKKTKNQEHKVELKEPKHKSCLDDCFPWTVC